VHREEAAALALKNAEARENATERAGK